MSKDSNDEVKFKCPLVRRFIDRESDFISPVYIYIYVYSVYIYLYLKMIYERSPKMSAALQTKYLPTYVYLILQDFLRSLLKFESNKEEWK